jgi:hypothetical protein
VSAIEEDRESTRTLAWAYLLAFIFLSSTGRAFYASQGQEPSGRFDLVCYWVGLTLVWLLTKAEARATRSALPLDSALFLGIFSYLALPFLLWRGQRWRSVGTAAKLVGLSLAGYVWGALLGSVIVALQ